MGNAENYLYELWSAEKVLSVHSAVSFMDVVRGPDFFFEGEQHDFWEIVYVLDGKAGITADDRIYTLAPGELIFHKPMEFHKIWSAEETEMHVCILSFEAYGKGTERLKNCVVKLDDMQKQEMLHIMDVAKKAFKTENGIIQMITAPKYVQIYFNLLENFFLQIGAQEDISRNNDRDSQIFSKIVQVLKQNICRRITIDYVAKQCNISTSSLKKKVQKYTGMGVMRYYTKFQMKEAMQMLSQDYSVLEVSEHLAFSSQFYFSSVFKKETGMTPTEYKRRML